jgi:hypothetical protein
MQALSNCLQKFIKMSLLELTTKQLDHRNSNKIKGKVSPLSLFITEHNYSFDKGISALCDSLASNPDVFGMIEKLEKIRANEDNDEEEDLDECEIDVFDQMIDRIGLYEIHSLHGDDVYIFREYFLECIYKRFDE